MKSKTMIATITLAVLPFFATFATATAQHADHHSPQATVEQSAGSAIMAGHGMRQGMMNVIDQVKNDLAALANENDLSVLHKRLAQDRGLLDQIHAYMSHSMPWMTGSMMSGQAMTSGGMMSGYTSNCYGIAQQPQK